MENNNGSADIFSKENILRALRESTEDQNKILRAYDIPLWKIILKSWTTFKKKLIKLVTR